MKEGEKEKEKERERICVSFRPIFWCNTGIFEYNINLFLNTFHFIQKESI